ncbi:MAG: TldD/PmbA family protein [Gammaproteobacteria bacterium]|jgi:TldD protein|nr:TldD/PmbA family protein [Gammaproteobacteria bacterium]MBT3860949.1 TldD/PmbA family protein [Gammaproteobacteria bacterium]MBT3988472.1 TldD/PmbA family protein [Gammaproteobacteria bacterium]MBT4256191.1 TldD/PmbA family protein [Gammaproteobacteria bacterium]MBT4581322.1 TldD/PmbA family protein [Gammaproteobacteria bacterium]
MNNIKLPIPANHLGSATSTGTPIYLPGDSPINRLSRRDFMRLSTVAAAAGILLPSPMPVAAQSMTSTEQELLLHAIDAARSAGADYADGRIIRTQFEAIGAREEMITQVQSSDAYGINVRALVGGSWGFSATQTMTRDAVADMAREAVMIANANNEVAPSETILAPVDVFPDADWVTPHSVDPFDISLEDKAALLLRINEEALRVNNIRFSSSSILSVKEERLLATSEGSMVRQTLFRINPSINITAISPDGSDFQTRGAVVEPAGRGYEYVMGLELASRAEGWAEEAAMKLEAPPVDPGKWDLVLHPSNLWLTIHEAIGHPTELDRALGFEANYAGTSFIYPPEDVIGKLQLGPEFMQFVGNRTEFGGCATTGWDDEGVPAETWPIIEDGIFVDYQTTREQAAWISQYTGITRSHGCSYGQNWETMPFQRMPNVSMLPGEEDLSEDDIIGNTDRGILVEGRGSYSIDQQRYNIQFGGQVFWEIRNGRKFQMLRDVAYVGRTPEFWNALDSIGGASTYYLGASFGDAKGQPIQVNAVSHGCPISLFRDIDIINTA